MLIALSFQPTMPTNIDHNVSKQILNYKTRATPQDPNTVQLRVERRNRKCEPPNTHYLQEDATRVRA